MEKVKSFGAEKLLILALCFALCIVSLLPVFMFKSSAEDETEGRAFTAADVANPLSVLNPYTEIPRAFAATVRFDGGTDTVSPIISNAKSRTATTRIAFEITAEGNPALNFAYKFDGLQRYEYVTKSSYITFNYNLSNRGEVHLVVVNEIVDGNSVYKLYADGELVDTVTNNPYVYNWDIVGAQSRTRTFSLGSDDESYFSGIIKNIAVYSDALTAEEVESVFASKEMVSHSDMMAYYDFTSSENTDRFIKDQTGNGHYASDLFENSKYTANDYAYSIAVVGDTQSLTIKDVTDGTNYTSYVYEWIAQNKDKKNIQFVMGLGDVTDENLSTEWQLVADLHNKLEDKKVNLPYSVIQGNHDTVKQLDKFFKEKDNFKNAVKNGTIGYFSEDSLANYYMTFTATDKEGNATNNKYLILNLECKVPDTVIPWANQVIEEHSDYQVIITTHEYVQASDSYFLHRYPSKDEGTANDPYQIWMKLASQHENVILVLSGHLSIPTIFLKNPVVGVNGNTVYEFLIDPQQFDRTYNYETGMVAMFYFSADGKTVKTEYVSTYKSLKAQELNPSAPDVISNPEISNYTLDIGKKVTLSDVECEYGTIPAAYANEDTYPFVVFKPDKTFVGGYFDLGDVMKAMVEIDASADYNVLMRRDAEQYYSSDVSEFRGNINVDLGGFTLIKCKPGYLINISVSDNSGVLGDDVRGSFKIMNGTINKCAGEALVCVDYGTADTGLSKTFTTTIDFENVVLAKYSRDDGTNLVFDTKETGYSKTSGDACAIVNSTFTNCTFDYRFAQVTGEALQLSGATGDRIVYNVKIVGSEILSTVGLSFSDFAVVDDNTNGRADSVVFAKNSDGELFIQKLSSGAIAPGAAEPWYGDDGKTYVPGESGTVDGYKIYKLGGYTESEYGKVPEGNEGYAILVFKNGSFAGGFNEFGGNSGAIAAAKILTDANTDEERGSTVYIYFVDDAPASSAYVNLGQSIGNIIIDLNGHTLTQKYTGESLFTTQAKLGTGLYPYSLTVINGNIVLTDKGVLTFDAYGDGYVNAAEEYKEFTGKFENVNFSYAEGSKATDFLGYYKNSTLIAPKKALYNVDFTDCTFDFTNAASMATVMNVNDQKNTSNSNDIIKVNVYGSEIITSNNALVLEDVHPTNGSSVHWEASSDGNYLYMTVNGSTEAPTSKVNGGASAFVKASETESSVTYTLESIGTYVDGYGVLLDEHADYTFVIFVGGVSVGASNEFLGSNGKVNNVGDTAAMAIAKNQSRKEGVEEVKILMRKDYTSSSSSTEQYSNIGQIIAPVTVDLGGHTFNARKVMFALETKSHANETTITLKNGNVVLTTSFLQFATYNAVSDGRKFIVNCENVNFSMKSGSTSQQMISAACAKNNNNKSVHAFFDVNFTDCVFDVRNASNHITIFRADDSAFPEHPPIEVKYKLNGCEIIAKSMDSFTTWGVFNGKSSYEYGVSPTTGLYTTITLPEGAVAPNPKEELVIGGKTLGYAKEGEVTIDDNKYTMYALGQMTKYGPIPPKFESVTSYPFVLFDQYGNCINASNVLYGSNTTTSIIHITKAYIQGNSSFYNAEDGTFGDGAIQAFILMRCDYDMQSENKYDHFSQIRGTVTIDLNGFTLNARDDKVMVLAYAKAWGILTTTEMVFKNGSIVTVGRPMLAYRGEYNTADGKKFIFRYEDINFKVEGSTANFLALYNGIRDEVTEQIKMSSEVYFKNCVIDITKATAESVVLFNLGDEYTSTNVTLDGVTIISGNGAFTLLGKTNEASTGVLKCVGNGITLVLPSGVEAPTDSYLINDGIECVFVKTSKTDENANYTLYPEVMVGYKLKTSVTLYSNFVYNIYIPKANVNSFTVSGSTEYEEVVIDDVTYYLVKVSLAAGEALSDINVAVKLNSGETTVSAAWTLNVLNYTSAVLNGEYNDTTKTLMKDMLVYASAAHTYFDKTLDDAKAAAVAELTKDYTKAVPTGTAKKPSSSTYFKEVTVNLDKVPSFVFTLADGYTADDFTFKVGGRSVTASVVDGKVEIVMYAYMMLDDVTYTVNATGVTESYNLYAYYEYAKTLGDAELTALVEGLMKYSVSAADYRASVIAAD